MISCDKCGFGHKTFEEKAACKSWAEMQAEELCTCGHTRSQHPQLSQDPANCRRGVCIECRCNEFSAVAV